jgi:hypothetical protein
VPPELIYHGILRKVFICYPDLAEWNDFLGGSRRHEKLVAIEKAGDRANIYVDLSGFSYKWVVKTQPPLNVIGLHKNYALNPFALYAAILEDDIYITGFYDGQNLIKGPTIVADTLRRLTAQTIPLDC